VGKLKLRSRHMSGSLWSRNFLVVVQLSVSHSHATLRRSTYLVGVVWLGRVHTQEVTYMVTDRRLKKSRGGRATHALA
jgi:hypothetical protein